MNKKTIIVREAYDWITEKDVSPEQFEDLIKYIEIKYPNDRILEQRYKRLRFINYVGVIVCSGVRYEIIPKINLSKQDERQALLSMLSITNFLPISFYEKVRSGKEKSDLLSVLLDRKSTRLNSSHVASSYAGFGLKRKHREQRRET